jgi:hypothetical protein
VLQKIKYKVLGPKGYRNKIYLEKSGNLLWFQCCLSPEVSCVGSLVPSVKMGEQMKSLRGGA